jgi:ABC-type nitrate/sulfonate/bicarbonate transport system substrate-binding protein
LKQLSGKSMAVSSATGLPRVVAQLILQKNGVDPKSVKYVNSGDNANRYKAVVTGTVDSASIPSDFVPQAKKDGVNVLAYAAAEVPQYPRFTIIARSDFLKKNPKAASAYLAGIIEGERYAFDHPDEAKALAAKALGGDTKADSPPVTNMYDQIVKEKLVNRNAEIPTSMLTYLQQTLIDIGEMTKPLDLSTLYTDQYRQAALKLVDKQSGSS